MFSVFAFVYNSLMIKSTETISNYTSIMKENRTDTTTK